MEVGHELFSENDMQSVAENGGQIGNWIREP